jgi:hypothetical protein
MRNSYPQRECIMSSNESASRLNTFDERPATRLRVDATIWAPLASLMFVVALLTAAAVLAHRAPVRSGDADASFQQMFGP